MPVNATVRSLAQDGRFSLQDAKDLKAAVAAGAATRADAEDAVARYAEAMDGDAASLLADSFQTTARGRQTSLPESVTGLTLQKGMRSEAVATLQRGLMGVGLSSQNRGMALASGADGIFGKETEASVRAFQTASGLPVTGKADPATLRALSQAMAGTQNTPSRPTSPSTTPTTTPTSPTAVRPSTGLRRPETTTPITTTPTTTPAPTPTTTPATTPATTPTTTPASTPATARAAPTIGVTLPAGVAPGTTEALIAGAKDLATGDRALHYGTDHPWRNIDPRHNAPVDVRMGGLKDRWKCNLFGGNAMAAAGFEPPYYGNRKTGGEYPVAEDWHKWSTPTPELRARAAANGESVVDFAKATRNPSRFDLVDQVQVTGITDPAAKRARIEEFLARVQPGDVVTADHVGRGSDGGHVRVCVGRDESGRPLFAQAKQDSARVVAEGVDDAGWANEEALYILRPNTPRE
jgi:peptidoglycan hydrolase-like protein with peptidoglycan-binding domain